MVAPIGQLNRMNWFATGTPGHSASVAERWISNVAGGPRRWLALTEPDESGLGGLGFLVLTLIEPVVRAISLPAGRTAASLAGLAAVAALFLISQRMTTQHPWSWRITVLAERVKQALQRS